MVFIMFFPVLVFAHGGKNHSKVEKKPAIVMKAFENTYRSINQSYKKEVAKIFEAKCFDCHSSSTNYPWYYQVPGVHQTMDAHIKEAKGHIDLTNGFPFKGHDSPLNDLLAIEKTINKGSMPPWYYKPFHKDSEIDPLDKKIILKWVQSSILKLKELK